MGKDVHFAYRLGGLCLPFLLFVYSVYSWFPPCLHSFPSGQLLSFLFSIVTFYYYWIGELFGLGSLTGRPIAEGYVAVFPCTISVLVYKTRQRLLDGD
jgi:hypothetical protein